MLHALHVAWTFFKIGLLNEFAYRANLYLQMLQSVVAVGSAIGGLLVVFGHTESLGGWGQDEVLAVLGVYLLMSAAMGGVIEPGMAALIEDVRLGTLDYTLTKPVDAQFLTSIVDIRVWKLVDVALGVLVLAVALARRGSAVGTWGSGRLRADAAGRRRHHLQLLSGHGVGVVLVPAHREHLRDLRRRLPGRTLADRHLPAVAALHSYLHRAGGDCRYGTGGGKRSGGSPDRACCWP